MAVGARDEQALRPSGGEMEKQYIDKKALAKGAASRMLQTGH